MKSKNECIRIFDMEKLFIRACQGRLLAATLALALLLLPAVSSAQDFSRTITKSATFADLSHSGNKFRIMNVNGSVTVEAYDGETLELRIKQQIEGTSSEINQAKKELEFKLERRGNVIVAYLDAPFITFDYDNGRFGYRNIDHDGDTYSFTHDIHVRVPQNIQIEASTMNKGDIHIIGSFKKTEARNLNGDVELKGITSQTVASTLNGDVTVLFKQAPKDNSTFKTLNGTIDVTVPGDLSADIYFESMTGDFYTDFENIRRLKPEIEKSKRSDHSTVTYRIDKFTPIRIGDGDIELRFELLNGNVYLRKR